MVGIVGRDADTGWVAPADDDLATAGLQGPVTHSLTSVLGLGAWALRFAPELVSGTARLMVNPRRLYRRARGHSRTASVLDDSIADLAPPSQRNKLLRLSDVSRLTFDRGNDRVMTRLPYGPAQGQTLEIWESRRKESLETSAPVVVYVPGGGWIHGSTFLQGYVLLSHLAERGWICVGVNYRASPAHRWPTHIRDVKRAIAWVHREIRNYGGNPDHVALVGASAGAHLAALAGLTSADPSWQPGFEEEPTNVAAVVGLYGRYDWESRDTPERRRFMTFLEHIVVGRRQDEAPDVFAMASPLHHVDEDAPPFFVIHGRSDAIIPVGQARVFVERLREVSRQPVAYAELPGTGHGFDMVDPLRATYMARAVDRFLKAVVLTSASAGETSSAARADT